MDSTFNVDICDRNNRKALLARALADGRISCDTERIQNIFSVSVVNQTRVIESWQKCYPELSNIIEGWKYAVVNDDNETTHDEFKIFPVPRGKQMLCVFLGIFNTSTPNILKAVHLCAKITFRVHHYEMLGNFSYAERAIMFILSDGFSEALNYTCNFIASSKENEYTQLLHNGDNTKILAGIILSENYRQIRINWV